MESVVASTQNPKIIVMGRTGAGKTTICNTLAGENIFEVGHDLISKTEVIQSKHCFLKGDKSFPIELQDSVGFHDNRYRIRGFLNQIMETIGQAQKGANIVFACFAGTRGRFDSTDKEDLNLILDTFTKEAKDNIYIIITQLNKLCLPEKEKAIKLYKTGLLSHLKTHGISWGDKDDDHMLFFDVDNVDPFIEKVKHLLLTKPRFCVYADLDLEDPLKTLSDPKVKKIIKGRINAFTESLMCLGNDPEETEILINKIIVLEILISEKGNNLETILRSIRDSCSLCKNLANFFLDSNEEGNTVYALANQILKDYNQNDTKLRIMKKEFIEDLEQEINSKLLPQICQRLMTIVRNNLELSSCREINYSNISLNKPSNDGERQIRQFVENPKFELLVEFYNNFGGKALALLLVGVGIFVGISILWKREDVIKDVAKQVQKKILEAENTKIYIIASLLTFCEIIDS